MHRFKGGRLGTVRVNANWNFRVSLAKLEFTRAVINWPLVNLKFFPYHPGCIVTVVVPTGLGTGRIHRLFTNRGSFNAIFCGF